MMLLDAPRGKAQSLGWPLEQMNSGGEQEVDIAAKRGDDEAPASDEIGRAHV